MNLNIKKKNTKNSECVIIEWPLWRFIAWQEENGIIKIEDTQNMNACAASA